MPQELPEGTVTVLFTDVEGSTDLTTRRGDEAAQEILSAQRELVRQQIEEHSGHEVKGLGDGFMVAFASARKAVACSVGIQRALEEHNRSKPLDEQVLIRIGLNTGEVIQEEADLFGETVNAAARVAEKAKGGQILVSEMVRGLLGRSPDVELVDRGRSRLKGFPERWRLYEVVWQEQATTAPALMERTPFVGREAERAELRRFLEQAARGQGALVMIGGEPGVGKTRLAEEMALEARQRGLLTLTGHCYEMEGAPPYIPFVEIVEASARLVPPEALRSALGESAPEVAKLMPELRRLFPDIPASPELPPEQERRYLFNGMRDFLARAGHVQPMFLLLDDLHWADDSPLLLLRHIAQQLHEMPVLVVGTYRDVELDVSRPLAKALEELVRQRLAVRVSVKRLPLDGVSAMLRALSGQEPPQPLVDVIYSETEGNPFFVEEVFHHLAEDGKLFDAKGRWLRDLEASELDVPEGIRLVIGRRLERAGEECSRALTAAAVIGRAFTFELLEAASDIESDALLDAVDEAERTSLISVTSEGPEVRFKFAHELIRQTLLANVSPPRRQVMHLRVADAIERVYGSNLEDHAATLAHHLYRAGSSADQQKTLKYLKAAADRAIEATAFEEALRLIDEAAGLAGSHDVRARADLLYRRGRALRSLGRSEDARKDWRQALENYEKLDDRSTVAKICSEIANELDWAAQFVEAVEVARRGLAAVGDKESAERTALLASAGQSLSLGGAYTASLSMISQAETMAESIGDQRLLGRVMTAKCWHHVAFQELEQLVESGKRGAALNRSVGNLWGLADALWHTQLGLAHLGRVEEVVEISREVEDLASRVGHRGALILARRLRGEADLMIFGDVDAYEAVGRADLEACESAGLPWGSHSHAMLGLAAYWKGEWERAVEHSKSAVRSEPPGCFTGGGLGFSILFEAYRGDRASALSMLRGTEGAVSLFLKPLQSLGRLGGGRLRFMREFTALQSFAGEKESVFATLRRQRGSLPSLGTANTLGSWSLLALAVEALAVLGEVREAAKLYPKVKAAGDRAVTGMWASHLIQRIAGISAAAGSRWRQAEEHYETALRQAHELPHVLEQPEVRRWYAQMLLDRDYPGDRDKARELLTEAIAMYRKIGMPKHVEMAEAMLREL